MGTKKKNIIESFKSITHAGLVYLSALILFFIIVIITFFYTIKFIFRNINETITIKTPTESRTFDINNYNLVTKKLNISIK